MGAAGGPFRLDISGIAPRAGHWPPGPLTSQLQACKPNPCACCRVEVQEISRIFEARNINVVPNLSNPHLASFSIVLPGYPLFETTYARKVMRSNNQGGVAELPAWRHSITDAVVDAAPSRQDVVRRMQALTDWF